MVRGARGGACIAVPRRGDNKRASAAAPCARQRPDSAWEETASRKPALPRAGARRAAAWAFEFRATPCPARRCPRL